MTYVDQYYSDVIMGTVASQITSLTIVRLIVKKTLQLRITGLCAGNSPGTGGFPAQMASNVENASIWWRHHACARSIIKVRDTYLYPCRYRGL